MRMCGVCQGNSYIIVFMDYLIKWVEACLQQYLTSETYGIYSANSFLTEVQICQFALPEVSKTTMTKL